MMRKAIALQKQIAAKERESARLLSDLGRSLEVQKFWPAGAFPIRVQARATFKSCTIKFTDAAGVTLERDINDVPRAIVEGLNCYQDIKKHLTRRGKA